jgi:hypothetical protein
MMPPPACSCGMTKISNCDEAERDDRNLARWGGGDGGPSLSVSSECELCGGGRGTDICCRPVNKRIGVQDEN